MKHPLVIALPKGRLGEKVYGLFEQAGLPCPAIRRPFRTRRAGDRRAKSTGSP